MTNAYDCKKKKKNFSWLNVLLILVCGSGVAKKLNVSIFGERSKQYKTCLHFAPQRKPEGGGEIKIMV